VGIVIDMQRLQVPDRFAGVPLAPRPPALFAVDTDMPHVRVVQFEDRFQPGEHIGDKPDRRCFQLLGLDQTENAPECVVRRNPVRQLEKLPEPFLIGIAKLLHVVPGAGAA